MYLISTSLALSLMVLIWYLQKERKAKSMPPGPPPLPVIGNLFDVPRKAEAQVYSHLADKYGKCIPFSSASHGFTSV